jgi:hypothetical protein
MHLAEIAQLLPRFAELDQAINSGARQWSPAQAAEAQQLLEAAVKKKKMYLKLRLNLINVG